MPQFVRRVLGGMSAGRRELARFAVPPNGAALPFDARLVLLELLLAFGELAAQMPLHPLGEAYSFKARIAFAPFHQHGLPSGRALLGAGWRGLLTCGGVPGASGGSG
ncbi:MAG: hypothetical protein ACLPX9_06930 [Rhodomicrobium sp.]